MISYVHTAYLNASPDPRTPYYPPPANVTFLTYHSVYAYSAWTLWLAYGIALFLSAIAVGLGYLAIFATGLSYSSSFSTVLRMTSHARLYVSISSQDAVGSDPLPRHLASATIAFEQRELKVGREVAVLT